MNRKVCYHGPACLDGFGAAYAAWKAFGSNAQYIAVQHGKPMPRDIEKADEVYVIDFCWPKQQMEWLRRKVPRLMVLDHHETSMPILSGQDWAVADQSKCGARLAWEHFHPTEPVPDMIRLIEDRDLWLWNIPESRPFCRRLANEPKDFTRWDALMRMTSEQLAEYVTLGRQLDDYHMLMVRRLAAGAKEVELCGVRGLAVNAPSLFSSELGHLLAERSGTFGAVWQVRDAVRGLEVKLRSVADINVAEMAAKFGGGGLKRAAGLSLPIGHLAQLL